MRISPADRTQITLLTQNDLYSTHSNFFINAPPPSTIDLSSISTAPYRTNRDIVFHGTIQKHTNAHAVHFPRTVPVLYGHIPQPIEQHSFLSVLGPMGTTHTRTINSNKSWANSKPIIPLPMTFDRSNIFNEPSEAEKNKRKRKRPMLLPWFCLLCLLCSILLLLLITAILLAILLPRSSKSVMTTATTTTLTSSTSTSSTTSTHTSSSTSSSSSTTSSTTSTSSTSSTASTTSSTSVTTTITTTATTTTVTTCSGGNGFGTTAFVYQTGVNPSFWTGYNYTYVATSTSPILLFSFVTDLYNNYFLDSVSVTLSTAPTIQLLNNPSFESSTTTIPNWIVSCNYTCSPSSGAQVTWGTNCYSSIGSCFLVDCAGTGSGSIVYLAQAFPAVIGSTYKISFFLRMAYGNIAFAGTQFTASII